MAAAVKGLISICVVIIILVSSWLIAVLINYYAGQGKELKVQKTTHLDPVPDDKLENIFWFMQVSLIQSVHSTNSSQNRSFPFSSH